MNLRANCSFPDWTYLHDVECDFFDRISRFCSPLFGKNLTKVPGYMWGKFRAETICVWNFFARFCKSAILCQVQSHIKMLQSVLLEHKQTLYRRLGRLNSVSNCGFHLQDAAAQLDRLKQNPSLH